WQAIAVLGGLDVLVNNAGILHFAHSPDVTPQMWDKTLAVNLTAPFHLSRAAIPHLLGSEGAIVNIASSGAIVGTAYATAYSSAKAGLVHMTKCLAMEYAKQPIRINAVAPGSMRTNIGRDLVVPEGADRELIARYGGLRPAVDPMEVAELVAFVASPRGSAIHGACLSADGGVTAG
ncbi:MAG: SDR family oxidoreductase, partial [Caulobacteraceae bacterium]|nr:SDR family oxidoreductase [Caulobacteraceae bacterium]